VAVFYFDIINGSRRVAGDRLEESDSAAAFAATTAALAIFQFQRPALREKLSITLRDERGRIIGTVVPPGTRPLQDPRSGKILTLSPRNVSAIDDTQMPCGELP
jgi:hypothetical protein